MKHIPIQKNSSDEFPIAILIKESALKSREICKHYADALPEDLNCVAIGLPYDSAKTVKASTVKEFLKDSLDEIKEVGVTHIVCADSTYFKTLTKVKKVDANYGNVLNCVFPGYEELLITLVPNYMALIYNPDLQDKIVRGVHAIKNHLGGTYSDVGTNLIQSIQLPKTLKEIEDFLTSLHQYPMLTADIEAFSLKHYEAGVGTIGFAWDEHNGGVFPVDLLPKDDPKAVLEAAIKQKEKPEFSQNSPSYSKRALLKKFFIDYEGTLIWHGATYDLKVLIYTLFMDNLLDQRGLLEGLEVMTKKFLCTKVISYLATNNCAKNSLSLKDLAQEFAGDWAQSDIKNILQIEPEKLYEYNLVDCLSTWFVYNKNWPILVKDDQERPFNTVFHPSLKTIIQMELTGNPLDMPSVLALEQKLEAEKFKATSVINQNLACVKGFLSVLRTKAAIARNSKLKNPKWKAEDFASLGLNPSSANQIRDLIYNYLGYEATDFTKSKAASTSADAIKKLKLVAKDPEHIELFNALLTLSEVSILLNNFIKNFKLAPLAPDGMHYLFGNFNLGGTKSGRLSSSNVNLQNLPSGGNKYAKDIKKCFKAPKGWLMVGSDFTALEDVVNTLLTKDPNKLKVWVNNYDGHCYRAFYFFPDRLPGIVDTVESINSIKDLFPDVRQDAKAPAFALQYQGTWMTLVVNCGFPEGLAKQIENNFLEMYIVSTEWLQDKLTQACKDGYVTLAYGLRLRTPVLGQTYLNTKYTPKEAAAEGRTAGNALSGQSYCLINSKAANEFMDEVRTSDYALSIRPTMQIHDAQYYLIRDDVELVHWVNEKVPFHMVNQIDDLPELYHPDLTLKAELDLFYPSWANACTLKNHDSIETIIEKATKHKESL